MYLDTFYRIHLEWMFENQPELVRELLQQNKLKDHLDEKEQRALRMVSQTCGGLSVAPPESPSHRFRSHLYHLGDTQP